MCRLFYLPYLPSMRMYYRNPQKYKLNSTPFLREQAGNLFAYKKNPLISEMMEPKEFWSVMPAVTKSLATKPALTELALSSHKVQAAILALYLAFSGRTRDRSIELLAEHSMRLGQGVASTFNVVEIPFAKAECATTKALLHDIIEDSDRDGAFVQKYFGDPVAQGVMRLSIPNDAQELMRVYHQVREAHPTLPENPSKDDIKFAYKFYYQAPRLRDVELFVKMLDTVDKPGSDAADLWGGDMVLGKGKYNTLSDIHEKNHARRQYMDLYIRRHYENDILEFYTGLDTVNFLVREANRMFAAAAKAMEKNAVAKHVLTDVHGVYHQRVADGHRSSLFVRRQYASRKAMQHSI